MTVKINPVKRLNKVHLGISTLPEPSYGEIITSPEFGDTVITGINGVEAVYEAGMVWDDCNSWTMVPDDVSNATFELLLLLCPFSPAAPLIGDVAVSFWVSCEAELVEATTVLDLDKILEDLEAAEIVSTELLYTVSYLF